MLVGVVGFLGSEVVLSPVVSHCRRLSPFMWGGGCWLVWPPSWALKWSCLPLSPVVSLHVGGGCWLVWPHLAQNIQKSKSQVSFKFAYCKLFGVYAGVIALTQCLSAGLQLRSSHETLRFCREQIRSDQEMKWLGRQLVELGLHDCLPEWYSQVQGGVCRFCETTS